MEILIFAIFGLLYFAIFLLFSALPFYIAYLIGRAIDGWFHMSFMKWLSPVLLTSLIGVWLGASYYTIMQECQTLAPIKGEMMKSKHPVGFRVNIDSSVNPTSSISFDEAIEHGFISYVEYDHGKDCAGKLLREDPSYYSLESGSNCEGLAPTAPLPEVYFMPKKKLNYWWGPPIYRAEIRVTDSVSGGILASAADLMIGGGVLGIYQRWVGGDQDYEYLGCGYAYSELRPWRPSLSSREEVNGYRIADAIFVTRALATK